MPIDMQGMRPLVSTRIDGVEARFMLDTGSLRLALDRRLGEKARGQADVVAQRFAKMGLTP